MPETPPSPPPVNLRLNLNGTSKAQLIEERLKARAAITDAIAALVGIHPHPRDYNDNTLGYEMDRRTHLGRLDHLRKMEDALYEEAIAISEQPDPFGPNRN